MRTRYDYRTRYKNMNLEQLTACLEKEKDNLLTWLIIGDNKEIEKVGNKVSYLKNKIGRIQN